MKKKIVIHSTSLKVLCTFCDCFSVWCCQLSRNISTAAPANAMVAGSRCSGRASTKATITATSTTSDCLSSVQSRIVSFALIPITRARRAGVDLSALPHRRWIITACAAITTMITGVR